MAEQTTGVKPPASVPYAAYESMLTVHERHVRRLLTALLIAVILIAASNGAWLYAWTRYDYMDTESVTETDTTVSQDGHGINIYGDGNEVRNGADDQNPRGDADQDPNQD